MISLFLHDNHVQFRKFATLPSFQEKGLGRQLLEHVFAFSANQGIAIVWFHALSFALSFYLNAKMQVEGTVFDKNDKDYIRMEKKLFLEKQP